MRSKMRYLVGAGVVVVQVVVVVVVGLAVLSFVCELDFSARESSTQL